MMENSKRHRDTEEHTNQYSSLANWEEKQKTFFPWNLRFLALLQLCGLSVYYFYLKAWAGAVALARRPRRRGLALLGLAAAAVAAGRLRAAVHLHRDCALRLVNRKTQHAHRWGIGDHDGEGERPASGLGLPSAILRDGRGILMDKSDLERLKIDGSCSNTVQGSKFIADSEGYVCFRAYVNPETGCCSAFYPSEEKKIGKLSKTVGGSSQSDAEDSSPSQTFSKDLAVNFDQTQPQLGQYSCFSCDSGSHCCQEYEMCVSCCMDPANRDVLEKFKSQSTHFVYQHTPLGFEFCRYKCRTSSGSVQNENSYRNPVKYCYGELLPELIPGSTVNSNGDTLNAMVKWGQKEVPMEPQKGVHQELRKATDLRHGTQYDPYFKEEGNGAAGSNQQGKIWGSLHDEEAQALAAPAEGGLVSKIWGSLGAEEALAGPAESVLVGEFRLEEPANAPPGQDSQIGGSLRGETSRAGQSKDPPNKIIPPSNSTPELKIITSKVQPELDEVG